MPNIFKALATITAWVLFIFGLFMVVITFIFMNVAQAQVGYAEPPPFQPSVNIAIGIASLVLSVVVMRMRQIME